MCGTVISESRVGPLGEGKLQVGVQKCVRGKGHLGSQKTQEVGEERGEFIYTRLQPLRASPGGSEGEESTCNGFLQWRPGFDPWVRKIPGGGHGNPLQYSCLENPQGQRSLVDCRLWGGTESDTTEVT